MLLLDEPSMGLAPKIVDEVFRVIEEIRASGHHRGARRAERPPGAARRRLRLRAARPARSRTPGPAAELLADERVIEAYLGIEGGAAR